MLFLIVPILIGFIIGITYGIKDLNEYDGWLTKIFFPMLLGFAGFMIGSIIGFVSLTLIAMPIGNATFETEDVCYTTEINALKDNTSIEGRKYLFSGYVKEDLIYRYVISTEYGKQIRELKHDNKTYIKEIKNIDKAYLKVYDRKAINVKWWQKLIGYFETKTLRIVFEVPNGTVTQEYNIDLE